MAAPNPTRFNLGDEAYVYGKARATWVPVRVLSVRPGLSGPCSFCFVQQQGPPPQWAWEVVATSLRTPEEHALACLTQ